MNDDDGPSDASASGPSARHFQDDQDDKDDDFE
jgi:hypothetical protein